MSHAAEESLRIAMALRDFFSAGNAAELSASIPGIIPDKKLSDTCARELEFEFNRLFVGPDTVPAPPYASVYLEKEPLLMGLSTLEVRELYRSLGLMVPEGGEPDDFLPYELEIWVQLSLLKHEVTEKNMRQNVHGALRWLVLDHLAHWLPPFIARVMASSPSPLMMEIVKVLDNWLDVAKENV